MAESGVLERKRGKNISIEDFPPIKIDDFPRERSLEKKTGEVKAVKVREIFDEFLGWYIENGFGQRAYGDVVLPTKVTEIYQWVKRKYVLSPENTGEDMRDLSNLVQESLKEGGLKDAWISTTRSTEQMIGYKINKLMYGKGKNIYETFVWFLYYSVIHKTFSNPFLK